MVLRYGLVYYVTPLRLQCISKYLRVLSDDPHTTFPYIVYFAGHYPTKTKVIAYIYCTCNNRGVCIGQHSVS